MAVEEETVCDVNHAASDRRRVAAVASAAAAAAAALIQCAIDVMRLHVHWNTR